MDINIIPVNKMADLNEDQLIQQLKQICRKQAEKYVEIWPERSAQVFYHLAQKYRQRGPDKISLIKSCGLLNAAISRRPSNVSQMQQANIELCQHVLSVCQTHLGNQAINTNVCLVNKAKEVKSKFTELRKKVDCLIESVVRVPDDVQQQHLERFETKKIEVMKRIQDEITKEYINIMADIGNYCETVLGQSPCKYAVTGMGSLARGAITPYSDFEHFIIVEDGIDKGSYLEYFRWFSVIFHIIVLNLQETIIPSLHIDGLNDPTTKHGDWLYDAHTTNGVSFDGMMPHACKFPLGRQKSTEKKQWKTELIKPVKEMLEYLGVQVDFKNGYHLSDILKEVIFVSGNKDLNQKFEVQAKNVEFFQNLSPQVYGFDSSEKYVMKDNPAITNLKQDFENFSARKILLKLKTGTAINVKNHVFRTSSLFSLALSKKYVIKSGFGPTISYQSPIMKRKLDYAAAIACEIRLRQYLKNNSQQNSINFDGDETNAIEEFVDLVGISSTIGFFQIVYCLQMHVAKLFEIEFSAYKHHQLFNILICVALRLNNTLLCLFTMLEIFPMTEMYSLSFETIIFSLEQFVFTAKKISQNQPSGCDVSVEIAKSLHELGKILYSKGFYNDAKDLFFHVIHMNNAIFESEQFADACSKFACCILHEKQPIKDLLYIRKPPINLEIAKVKENKLLACLYDALGLCLFFLRDYQKSQAYFRKVLDFYKSDSQEMAWNKHSAIIFRNIGLCLLCSESYNEALECFKISLNFFSYLSLDSEHDPHLAMLYADIAVCSVNLDDVDSFQYVKKSISIAKNSSEVFALDIANALHNTGHNLMDHGFYTDASQLLQFSLEVYKTYNEEFYETETHIALFECKIHTNKYSSLEEKNKHLQLDLQNINDLLYQFQAEYSRLRGFGLIDKTFTFASYVQFHFAKGKYQSDSNEFGVAYMGYYMGLCQLLDNKSFKEALTSLQSVKEVYLIKPIRAALHHCIGLFHLYTEKYSESLKCFLKSLHIYLDIDSEPSANKDVSFLLFSIAECLMKLDERFEAIEFLCISVKMYISISNKEKSPALLELFSCISDDLLKLNFNYLSLIVFIRELELVNEISIEDLDKKQKLLEKSKTFVSMFQEVFQATIGGCESLLNAEETSDEIAIDNSLLEFNSLFKRGLNVNSSSESLINKLNDPNVFSF